MNSGILRDVKREHLMQLLSIWSGKVCMRATISGPSIRSNVIPVSVAWSNQDYFYSPLPPGASPSQCWPRYYVRWYSVIPLAWMERGTVKVKVSCPRTQRNVLSEGSTTETDTLKPHNEATVLTTSCGPMPFEPAFLGLKRREDSD